MTLNPRTTVEPRFDPQWLLANAETFGCSGQEIEDALDAVRSGNVVGLACSGKLASGKDTVTPAVLARLGVQSCDHLFFARPMKAEFDEVLTLLRTSADRNAAAWQIETVLGIPREHAGNLAERFYEVANADLTLTAYSRTPEIRHGLQYLGTEIRRSMDEDWWVKRSIGDLIRAFASGRSVYYTDCRFPNEALGVAMGGCFVFRLEVTPETQEARLAGRDGLAPDPAALAHPSETSLDNYDGFDLVVSNDGEIEHAIAAVLAGVASHRARLRGTEE
jgi:hypothetical protein